MSKRSYSGDPLDMTYTPITERPELEKNAENVVYATEAEAQGTETTENVPMTGETMRVMSLSRFQGRVGLQSSHGGIRMSSSPQYLFGYDRDGNLRVDDKRAAITFVERLGESHNFCDWCYVPLRGETSLDDLPLQTCRTFDSQTALTEGVPPDEVDETGGVVNVSRDVLDVCA